MKKTLYLAAMLLLSVGTLVGCGSKSPALPKSQPDKMEVYKSPVNLLHRSLKKKIASEVQENKKGEDGRMEISVVLRNRSKKPLNVEVRTVFKDEKGLSIGDESAWEDLYFEPYQLQTIRARSKTTTPVSYTVEVRKP